MAVMGSRRILAGPIGICAGGLSQVSDKRPVFVNATRRVSGVGCGRPARGRAMNPLLFECPTTGRRIEVGIAIDYASLRNVQPVTIGLLCPLCDRPHEWKLHEGLVTEPPAAAQPIPVPIPLAAWS